LGGTIRRAIRLWWDYLGLATLVSTLSVVATAAVLAMCQWLGLFGRSRQPWGLAIAALCVGALWAYLAGVLHHLMLRTSLKDDVSLAAAIRLPRRYYMQALGLAAVQLVVTAACVANVWFYVAWRTTLGVILAVALAYILAMWLMTCMYHWPLLAAAQLGVIPPAEAERGPRLRGVLRNGLVLSLSAPAYTAGLALVALIITTALILTGVGLVIAAPAFWAILGTQAVHDHMVRLGMLPPPDEGPTGTDEWHVPDG